MTQNSEGRQPSTGAAATDGPEIPADVAALGYEEAKDELIRIVAQLESGGAPLEASLALWERGEALAAQCQRRLDGARERLDRATANGSEAPAAGASPADGADDDTD
ncbi:hypothetical protein GCM10025865_02640 [Paraoerskovia sediminicola]|uniref:Exodeoxyribonuclease 7 small subunit n=1 Tax=Paraoerskovia sediminicola TaxID=1138587 RepID=A0ABN6XB20_9CELL|nr:exodeoxyribonuclease VII small subunit [Paraoerskovia sediminicola]BDZ40965.1 hypothetical protein GCM10025865_02640 [Paraoerskovia sediminicola]